MGNIIIDVDDTMHPFHEPFYRHHDERYGSKASKMELSRDMPDVLRVYDWPVLSERILEFYAETDPASLKPLPGLGDALKAISDHHRIWFMSSRDDSLLDYTQAWIETHLSSYAVPYEDIIHTSSERYGVEVSKVEFAHRVGIEAEAIIEDDPTTARAFRATGTTAFLIPYPYNELADLETIIRSDSIETAWPEIAEQLLSTQI